MWDWGLRKSNGGWDYPGVGARMYLELGKNSYSFEFLYIVV